MRTKSMKSSTAPYNGVYRGERARKISFPLGGIGSGCVGLAGNGALIDWEIFGRPNLGGKNGQTHFAVRAEHKGRVLDTRVLHGTMPDHLILGTEGLPHFADVVFHGRFPFAMLEFRDERFPGIVRLTAFNPLIPGNDKDSSIPGAFFQIEIENTTGKDLQYSVAISVQNPHIDVEGVNQFGEEDGVHFLHLRQDPPSDDLLKRGDLCIATDAADVSFSECWKRQRRGHCHPVLTHYWRDFCAGGHLKSRPFVKVPRYNISPHAGWYQPHDNATLAAHVCTAARASCSFRFVLAWNTPFMENPAKVETTFIRRSYHTVDRSSVWRNYYATVFRDSAASAQYALRNWDRLYRDTRRFADALEGSTLPPVFLEAITANLAILKSPTLLRLEDGSLYGFEGSSDHEGSCFGSSSHVWQYAYSIPFLFPALERSMREIEIQHTQRPDGGLLGRVQLPLGCGEHYFRPAVDGHFATVIKLYRDWKISGDTGWLRPKWEAIRKMISYAWADTNPDRWDHNRDGVIEGRQHCTYDNELFGPNAYLTGFYLAALKAAGEMARALRDAGSAKLYAALYKQGSQWVQSHLYNGSYYIQQLDLHDPSILAQYPHTDVDSSWYDDVDATGLYWEPEDGEVMCQLGDGCFIDQLLSQWHASRSGLGDIFPKDRVRKTLQSIVKNNSVPKVENHFNPDGQHMAVDGESGTVICTWPKGTYHPVRPIRYSCNFWPGCEYALAALLVQEGFVSQAQRVVAAVRDRFDGRKRNPWCEFEAGRYYVRSMSSYSLLLAASGFEYDLTRGMIGFNPAVEGTRFHCFWSLGRAWGTVTFTKSGITLKVLQGTLRLSEFRSRAISRRTVKSVKADAKEISFTQKDAALGTKKPVLVEREFNVRF